MDVCSLPTKQKNFFQHFIFYVSSISFNITKIHIQQGCHFSWFKNFFLPLNNYDSFKCTFFVLDLSLTSKEKQSHFQVSKKELSLSFFFLPYLLILNKKRIFPKSFVFFLPKKFVLSPFNLFLFLLAFFSSLTKKIIKKALPCLLSLSFMPKTKKRKTDKRKTMLIIYLLFSLFYHSWNIFMPWHFFGSGTSKVNENEINDIFLHPLIFFHGKKQRLLFQCFFPVILASKRLPMAKQSEREKKHGKEKARNDAGRAFAFDLIKVQPCVLFLYIYIFWNCL